MKRFTSLFFTLCLLIAWSPPSSIADKPKVKVRGVVTSINQKDQSFVVKGAQGKEYVFATNKDTEFEVVYQSNLYDEDVDSSFQELTVGDHVKVKAYKGTNLVVDEITIFH